MIDQAAVANGIRRLLKAKGQTQAAVGRAAGYSDADVCNMLRGRKTLKASDLFRIADAMGVTAEEIRRAAE